MAISFTQLQEQYGNSITLIEITDRDDAIGMIESKASSCWGAGAKISDSGWIQLATPSKEWNAPRLVFVCLEMLVR